MGSGSTIQNTGAPIRKPRSVSPPVAVMSAKKQIPTMWRRPRVLPTPQDGDAEEVVPREQDGKRELQIDGSGRRVARCRDAGSAEVAVC